MQLLLYSLPAICLSETVQLLLTLINLATIAEISSYVSVPEILFLRHKKSQFSLVAGLQSALTTNLRSGATGYFLSDRRVLLFTLGMN